MSVEPAPRTLDSGVSAMRVRVILFGGLRRIVGRREVDLDFDAAPCVSAAIQRLGVPLEAVGLAVLNGEAVPLETMLTDGDELGVFSPVAGG